MTLGRRGGNSDFDMHPVDIFNLSLCPTVREQYSFSLKWNVFLIQYLFYRKGNQLECYHLALI